MQNEWIISTEIGFLNGVCVFEKKALLYTYKNMNSHHARNQCENLFKCPYPNWIEKQKTETNFKGKYFFLSQLFSNVSLRKKRAFLLMIWNYVNLMHFFFNAEWRQKHTTSFIKNKFLVIKFVRKKKKLAKLKCIVKN